MLSPTEQKALETYEKQVNEPKWKFIIINGFVWAILVLVIMSLIEIFVNKRSLQEQWKEGLLIRIGIFLIGGIVYGWLTRKILVKKYNELKRRQ